MVVHHLHHHHHSSVPLVGDIPPLFIQVKPSTNIPLQGVLRVPGSATSKEAVLPLRSPAPALPRPTGRRHGPGAGQDVPDHLQTRVGKMALVRVGVALVPDGSERTRIGHALQPVPQGQVAHILCDADQHAADRQHRHLGRLCHRRGHLRRPDRQVLDPQRLGHHPGIDRGSLIGGVECRRKRPSCRVHDHWDRRRYVTFPFCLSSNQTVREVASLLTSAVKKQSSAPCPWAGLPRCLPTTLKSVLS